MKNLSTLMFDKVQEMVLISAETSAYTEEVSASTHEQNAIIEDVVISANNLQELAVDLERLVNQFQFTDSHQKVS